MAENETEELIEDAATDENSSEVEGKKGLSKPTLIKIAIGIVSLLIIAGGAYFFFMTSDEPPQTESLEEMPVESLEEMPLSEPDDSKPTTAGEDAAEGEITESETPPGDKEPVSEKAQLLEMREAAVELKEENLRMKMRLMELDKLESINPEASKPEDGESEADAEALDPEAADVEVAPKAKVKKKSQYSNLYTRENSPVRETISEPPPEPKWGKFDPLYRGK